MDHSKRSLRLISSYFQYNIVPVYIALLFIVAVLYLVIFYVRYKVARSKLQQGSYNPTVCNSDMPSCPGIDAMVNFMTHFIRIYIYFKLTGNTRLVQRFKLMSTAIDAGKFCLDGLPASLLRGRAEKTQSSRKSSSVNTADYKHSSYYSWYSYVLRSLELQTKLP